MKNRIISISREFASGAFCGAQRQLLRWPAVAERR